MCYSGVLRVMAESLRYTNAEHQSTSAGYALVGSCNDNNGKCCLALGIVPNYLPAPFVCSPF